MSEKDCVVAHRLQQQYDDEELAYQLSLENWDIDIPSNEVKSVLPKDISIIDPLLETHDPNPDIHAMFLEFNQAYFWGKLDGVEVRWSPRMTLCAGICRYEGRGGLCTVGISEPLMKLRKRRDLVETLLHEMIHAYLFVTDNNKDHDAHGPEFLKHMCRINDLTGTNITVYHTFHDEVDEYRKHWWRCTGPCRDRQPYFGIIRRAMNRAPSPRDLWWAEHRLHCNGEFIKICEPEKPAKKRAIDEKLQNGKKKSASVDLRTIFQPVPQPSSQKELINENAESKSSDNVHGIPRPQGKTVASVIAKPSLSSEIAVKPKISSAKLPFPNTASDLKTIAEPSKLPFPSESADKSKFRTPFIPFTGSGQKLGSGNGLSVPNRASEQSSTKPMEHPLIQKIMSETSDSPSLSTKVGPTHQNAPNLIHHGTLQQKFPQRTSKIKSGGTTGGQTMMRNRGSSTMVLTKRITSKKVESLPSANAQKTEEQVNILPGVGHTKTGNAPTSFPQDSYRNKQQGKYYHIQPKVDSWMKSKLPGAKSPTTNLNIPSNSIHSAGNPNDRSVNGTCAPPTVHEDAGTSDYGAAATEMQRTVFCPSCGTKLQLGDINDHLDQCLHNLTS